MIVKGEEVYLLICWVCSRHRWSHGGYWRDDKLSEAIELAEKLGIGTMMAHCCRHA